MKTPLLLGILAFLFLPAAAPASQPAPPLHTFSTIQADALGARLQDAMIWTQPPEQGVPVVFRKTFALSGKPTHATLYLFADARYILWVNGTYVERGPSRFQPNGPEYDSIDLTSSLQAGSNALAVLVVGNLSGGKVMRHESGLTALLEADGKTVAQTDASWKWSDQTRYRECTASWPNLRDTLVDARVDDGDWTRVDYADSTWKPVEKISSASWGNLTARRIPRLRESPVAYTLSDNAHLPVTLQAGQKIEFSASHLVQAYLKFNLRADAGAELDVKPYGLHYITKAGEQEHFTLDTQGSMKGSLEVKTGTVTITGLQWVERLYPFDCVGSFHCNDDYLNKLWAFCARSVQVLSEDAYVDCADRERVEWMDNDPPGYEETQVAMAGPGENGHPRLSDPRLLEEMVRRTALTLQPDGWVKAHTCSDRYDIHAKMEDRACEWVAGIRRYYEATGDKKLVQEIWPAVVAQMDYFLQRRTSRGLVLAREWVVWGNPVGYVTLEGAGLNAFVYRALADASFLGGEIGETDDSRRFDGAARDLAQAFNTVLWDDQAGTFYSGYFDPTESPESAASASRLHLKHENNLVEATVYPAIFALDRGIVSPEHRDRVLQYVVGHRDVKGRVMIYYYLHKLLYGMDTPVYDTEVLDCYRKLWAGMVAAPAQCSWEEFGGGSHAHCYGLYPGYFLSSYVLGVRRTEPVANHHLLIEPHLGDLTRASGQVVTEFGLVPVSWVKQANVFTGDLHIPDSVQATLALPVPTGTDSFQLDGKPAPGQRVGARLLFTLQPGAHRIQF